MLLACAFALGSLGAACADTAPRQRTGDDPEAGAAIIARTACGVCHTIPGIPGADGIVGPSLDGFARRTTIAGVAPNEPRVLIRWIQDAPSIAPDTLMPPMPLDEGEVRSVAEYLYTLR
jgi:mono/diheme cytochrome c family protein